MSEQEATLDEFIEESENPERKSVRWGPKKKTIPGDWNFYSIIEHASEIIYPQRDKPTRFDGDIPWVQIEDLDGIYISEPTDDERYVSRELMDEMNLRSFPKGTLMCSCSTTMGVCAITTRDLLSNQHLRELLLKIQSILIISIMRLQIVPKNWINSRLVQLFPTYQAIN